MSFFIGIFNAIFYQPLLKAMILLYEYLPGHDFGVAIIVLTILIKFALYPLGSKGIKSQKALQDIQPKIKEIQAKFKDDKAKQAKETMELYKREKINPFSGFALLLIQLPILFALFRVFWKGLEGVGVADATFLGVVNLAEGATMKIMEGGAEQTVYLWPTIFLIAVAGAAQFWQAKMMTPRHGSGQAPRHSSGQAAQSNKPDFSGMMQKQMLYFFPLFTLFILWRMPSAVALYWITTTFFTIGQQYITLKKNKRDVPIKQPKN